MLFLFNLNSLKIFNSKFLTQNFNANNHHQEAAWSNGYHLGLRRGRSAVRISAREEHFFDHSRIVKNG